MNDGLILATCDNEDEFDLSSVPPRREALAILGRPNEALHYRRKLIDTALVQKAESNEPFGDFSRAAYGVRTRFYGEDTQTSDRARFHQECATRFLRRVYHQLVPIEGISFAMTDCDFAKESQTLEVVVERYKRIHLEGQVSELRQRFAGLCGVRQLFAELEKQQAFSFETVLPARYLPEILMAAPVWFIDSKHRRSHPKRPVVKNNPEVTFFCDMVGTREFSWLYQMYNRLPLGFADFSGDDVLPENLVSLVERVREHFDFLVIATPYHDLATKEWRVTKWVRNVDPFLFGFLRHLPGYMFFLGRWSGTGLFPLVTDMIADTVEHIRTNKLLLRNFHSGISWYKGLFPETLGVAENNQPVLPSFVTILLRAYEQGNLFSFLRGEVSPSI